jgi:phosphoribosylformylglycinamidine synthase
MDAWTSLLADEAHAAVPVTILGAVADHGRFRLSLGSQPVLDQAVQTLTERFDQALPRRLGTA